MIRRVRSMDGETTQLIRRHDALSEATQILEESSKDTKRKILISLNAILALVIVLHVTIQLATAGTLPDPARDAVVMPLFLLINVGSAGHNVRMLRHGRPHPRLDAATRWLSVLILQLVSLAIVHFNPNTATSILIDHSLSIVTVFLTGLILGRRAAVGWCLVTIASLILAVANRGFDFEYTLMTRSELAALHGLAPAEAGERARTALAEKLLPLPVTLFAAVSIVFTGITVAATYFESGLIGRVLAAMPVAVKKIQIATRERQQLEEENVRMGMELDVARRLQAMILPRGQELRAHPGLEIAAHMVPASEIGGDIYDVLGGPGDSTCLVIGDVTDHGLASGVVMLMAQSALRTALEQTDGDLVRSLVRVNSVIYKNVSERLGDARNLTLALLLYDSGKVRLAGQHETVIVVRASGAIEEFDTIDLGINVGLMPEVDDLMAERTFELARGDLMVLYTDGVTEAEAPDHQQYGVQRLKDAAHANRSLPCEQIRERIFKDIYAWIGGGKILDDITLVLVRRTI